MNHSRRILVLVSSTVLVLGSTAVTFAQIDVNPPRPNVLLLVDSSGSMEYTRSKQAFPVCDKSTAVNNPSTKSRWIELVEALSGTIPNYRCEDVARNSTSFLNWYKVAGANPPDYLYPISYHRPMSAFCAPAPGTNTGTISDSIHFCAPAASLCSASDCTFGDAPDGLLDAFKNQVRFGLMTFDTLPSASTGIDGTWTYVYGTPVHGAPKDCQALKEQDVGARNATAPLWEGRLIAFGAPTSPNELDLIGKKNQQIQQALLATRPFGATPIAGMLKDARDYFWNDPNPDGSGDIAPKNDPYVSGNCRANYIILLTDGEPNMELRPFCESTTVNSVCGPKPGDCCPFEKPEDIADKLARGTGGAKVQTFVIGFAVSSAVNEGVTVKCSELTVSDLTSTTGLCATTTSSDLRVCCKLNQIAYNGGTSHAYFADSTEKLRAALAEILNRAAQGTTSRTFPVFASATGSNSSTASFRFFTSFKARMTGTGLWPGVIERQRYVCGDTDHLAKLLPIDPEKGDDFAKNVNTTSTPARRFLTVVGETSGGTVASTRTLRKYATAASVDGAGSNTGTLVDGNTSTFPDKVPALALNVSTCTSTSTAGTTTTLTANQCRDRYIKWIIGTDNGTNEGYHRCTVAGDANCSLVADVYHSVPALVNRPSDNLRDESYQRFALTEQRKRPLVLYTSTNDGFLHAFKVASNDTSETSAEAKVETRTNNELWAFMPPAVLPRIASEYPNVHQTLLDGAPVTRDVAGYKDATSGAIRFERNLKTIGSTDSIWRTVLVQSFGGSYAGYFAIDITDPVTGPQFLWQLTTDANDEKLFGDSGSTPTITTLYFDPDKSGNAREISVAILPGGNGGAAPDTTKTCSRASLSTSGFTSDITPRTTQMPCYDTVAARRARSLTIVRLDTGEIIRTFRRSKDDAPASIAALVGESPAQSSPLDAPITGQPVAYPGWTGAIADRAYVGDRDGSLWRVDLSATDPSQWTMKLFFDAYHGKSAHSGQPIVNAPVVSTNDLGEVVVAFSTGNQEDLVSTASTETFLYSIREKSTNALSTTVTPTVNWYYRFIGGERITGPITLFSNGLYFSTYAPPSGTEVCNPGTSRVGGMHYLNRDTSATQSVDGDDSSRGGVAMLPRNGDSTSTETEQFYDQTDALFAQGSVIFGVGVAQVPSCFEESTASTDPFFGTTYKQTTVTSPTTYQLVMQTGTKGTTAETGGETKTVSVNLPPLDTSPRIDAWALVME